MKHILLIIFFSLIYFTAFAQDIDSSIVNIHYMASVKVRVEEKTRETEMLLSIGNKYSVFCDRWNLARKEATDSVKKAGGKFPEMMKARSKYPSPSLLNYIYINYPQKGERMEIEFLGKDVYYTEKIEPIKWELTDRDTIIAEYNCLSAIGTYHGHKWHVYYTTEIPLSVGPWKLHGLPGAILYAKEDLGNATFDAIEVRTPKKVLPIPNLSKAIKCTRKDFQEMKIEEAHNPNEFTKKRFGYNLKGWNADGTPIVYKPKTAIFLED